MFFDAFEVNKFSSCGQGTRQMLRRKQTRRMKKLGWAEQRTQTWPKRTYILKCECGPAQIMGSFFKAANGRPAGRMSKENGKSRGNSGIGLARSAVSCIMHTPIWTADSPLCFSLVKFHSIQIPLEGMSEPCGKLGNKASRTGIQPYIAEIYSSKAL